MSATSFAHHPRGLWAGMKLSKARSGQVQHRQGPSDLVEESSYTYDIYIYIDIYHDICIYIDTYTYSLYIYICMYL